ncbi:lipocalin-like domain-containing protein [Caldimonas sp. KR1-144]|uniref:lipocalin-like domain-containing protein n=1 Tax=Caldimonas sp. KR1-144 TaxID=3400911 RepID=UPI003BFC93CC
MNVPGFTRRRCLALLAASGGLGLARADAPHRGMTIALPRDFGAHPEQRIEWWYITGRLLAESDAQAEYGFQLTFFRSLGPAAADHPSRFAARELIVGHLAISDVRAQRLRHAERVARAGFGLAEAATHDTDLRLHDWTLRREAQAGSHRYLARLQGGEIGLELQLAATQPVLLQGEHGWSRKGPRPEDASGYLSEPQLDAAGEITLDGRRVAVRGRAWLDHEWSDALLPPQAVGWDWCGINLDDGGALTAFRLRRADGSALWAGGSHRPAGGATRAFGPDELRFTPLAHWTSAATGGRYPVAWRLETPLGVHELRARFAAQELDARRSSGAVYWEGLSRLHRAGGGEPVGDGYLEMTGYAAPLSI